MAGETLPCPMCEYETVEPNSITRHFEKVHMKDDGPPFAAQDEANDPSLAPHRPRKRSRTGDESGLALSEHCARRPRHRSANIEDDASVALAMHLQSAEDEKKREIEFEKEADFALALALQEQEEGAPQQDPGATKDDLPYVACPVQDCGDYIHLSDYSDHIELHSISAQSLEADLSEPIVSKYFAKAAAEGSRSLPLHSSNTITRTMASCRNNEKASPRAKAKAVKEDLGPFYDEARMPAHVYDQLKRGAAPQRLTQIGRDGRLVTETLYNNEVSGIIPVLAKLAALSETVEQAYLCHPAVQHVFKQPREGGFCGYRNLQMLISYIQGAKSEGYGLFQGRVPGILRIQDMIEEAWDRGFCTYGRLQVGRLRGTRKWIGTPEVSRCN